MAAIVRGLSYRKVITKEICEGYKVSHYALLRLDEQNQPKILKGKQNMFDSIGWLYIYSPEIFSSFFMSTLTSP